MGKQTYTTSDISGSIITDERNVARIRVTYADGRKGSRVIDATVEEADGLLGSFGRVETRRGRKPQQEPTT